MKKHSSFTAERCYRFIPLILFILFSAIAPAFAADDCSKTYPNPLIKFDHKDAEGRIYIPVINFAAYANEMFRQAPELPPCGLNTKSSRTSLMGTPAPGSTVSAPWAPIGISRSYGSSPAHEKAGRTSS